MTESEKLERVRYLQAQGRRIVQRERREQNEIRIKQTLQKILDYYVSLIEESFSPRLSSRIDYLTYIIESMEEGQNE